MYFYIPVRMKGLTNIHLEVVPYLAHVTAIMCIWDVNPVLIPKK